MDSAIVTIGSAIGDHVDLQIAEITPAGQQCAGDFRIWVTVTCDGFSAPKRDFWIDRSTFERFLGSLSAFERTRIGTATLESMSPDEFLLSVFSSAPVERPTISGRITGPYFDSAHRFTAQLNFAFSLDSGLVGQLLFDFQNLLRDEQNA